MDLKSNIRFDLSVCWVTMEENGAHFFEGTEKLLEVWFSRQDDNKGTGDLRSIPRLVTKMSVAAICSFPNPKCHPVEKVGL